MAAGRGGRRRSASKAGQSIHPKTSQFESEPRRPPPKERQRLVGEELARPVDDVMRAATLPTWSVTTRLFDNLSRVPRRCRDVGKTRNAIGLHSPHWCQAIRLALRGV